MNKWRLIDLSTHDAFTNMAIDEVIFNARIQDEVPNTIRFYRWKPSAVSIGRNQSVAVEVDVDACKSLGIDIVRRITGGGAVYHDYEGEITYSIIAREGEGIPKDIDESFRKLCRGIILALRKLGLEAEHGVFHCPSIFVKNRKISGNAQVRKKGVILQHGTILFDYDPSLMYSVLKVRDGVKKEKVVRSVYQKVTTIKQEISDKSKIKMDLVKKYLVDGFQEAFNVSFEVGNLEVFEKNRLHQSIEKFSSKKWLYRIE
ncbi:MAG: lipoate--protein ligase family protein [Candidatus Helarchaeota archaeon]